MCNNVAIMGLLGKDWIDCLPFLSCCHAAAIRCRELPQWRRAARNVLNACHAGGTATGTRLSIHQAATTIRIPTTHVRLVPRLIGSSSPSRFLTSGPWLIDIATSEQPQPRSDHGPTAARNRTSRAGRRAPHLCQQYAGGRRRNIRETPVRGIGERVESGVGEIPMPQAESVAI